MLIDANKVVNGLETCITFNKALKCGEVCPYNTTYDGDGDRSLAVLKLHEDALNLIRSYKRIVRDQQEEIRTLRYLLDAKE